MKEVNKGDPVSRPTSDETAGYTINYWYTFEDGFEEKWNFAGCVVNSDLDLYADFTSNQYTVQFEDIKFGYVISDVVVTYNQNYSFSILNETGYTHIGFKDDEETFYALSGKWNVPNNKKLYVVWSANTYRVNLNPNGGSVDSDYLDVAFDSSYQLPVPIKNNYVFLGWFENETRISGNATWKYTSNKTVLAKWTNVVNTYSFDPCDGTCSTESQVILWDEEYTLPTPNAPTGYFFDGWYLNDLYIPQTGIWTYSNIGCILEARYIENCYSINYDGTIPIISVKTGHKERLEYIVPSIYHGGRIEISFFSGCTQVEKVIIKSNAKKIRENAFYNLTTLKTLIIGENIEDIDHDAFFWLYKPSI